MTFLILMEHGTKVHIFLSIALELHSAGCVFFFGESFKVFLPLRHPHSNKSSWERRLHMIIHDPHHRRADKAKALGSACAMHERHILSQQSINRKRCTCNVLVQVLSSISLGHSAISTLEHHKIFRPKIR